MNKLILIIDECTSIPRFALEPQEEHTRKELKEIGTQWVRQYLKDNGYNHNPFYFIVTTQNQVKKSVQRIKI